MSENKNDINLDEVSELINSNQEVYDINISSIEDLINILNRQDYDFASIEPGNENVKIIFKKDGASVKESIIRFNIYSNLLLSIKKETKLDLAVNDKEQKGKSEYSLNGQNFLLISKIVPGKLGENILFKAKSAEIHESNGEKADDKKSKVSITKALGFLSTILVIGLIFGGVFLSFVIFNAQEPEDVVFFTNLGINLNDINSFLLRLTNFIFTIVLGILSLLGVIFLFKTLTTKKDQKKKKILNLFISIIILILLFTTGTLWISLDKKVKNLPNWQELSYGSIQIYDNSLLTSGVATKDESLIRDYKTLIGPIDLKFDLKYLYQEELKQGFKINKYIWDFGDGDTLETIDSSIIKTFSEKGTYTIKLTLEGTDSTGKQRDKEANGMPLLNVSNIVNIETSTLANGGVTYKFNATDLSKLGKIEWYLGSDFQNAAYTGSTFQPSKIYFDQEIIGMKINDGINKKTRFDKFFIVSGEQSKIGGDIEITGTLKDYEYILRPKDISNTFGDGFIEKFVWIIEDTEIEKQADITNLETSGEITYKFKEYGNHIVKLQIYNSNGKSTEISKDFTVKKQISLKNDLIFHIDGVEYTDYLKNNDINEYSLYNVGFPSTVKIDTKNLAPDNSLYRLKEINWDYDNDGNTDEKGQIGEFELVNSGFNEVGINYTYVNRKDSTDVVEVNQLINIEAIEKEAILSLEITQDSEYAPATVQFDASKSSVLGDNIIKFMYDYGDGITEERDAINKGHRYLTSGNYDVTLTVYTQNGKKYSISKSVIIKPPYDFAKITTSLKKAPVGQSISFSSSSSLGQIKSYYWDFGDGETSTDANPEHSYSEKGNYNVILKLEFDNNNTMSDNIDVIIYK